MSTETEKTAELAQTIYNRVRPQDWAPTAMTDFAECVSAAAAVIESDWLKRHDIETLEAAKLAISSDTNPHDRYGSLNEGSRSTWFSRGLREAVRRIDMILEASK